MGDQQNEKEIMKEMQKKGEQIVLTEVSKCY